MAHRDGPDAGGGGSGVRSRARSATATAAARARSRDGGPSPFPPAKRALDEGRREPAGDEVRVAHDRAVERDRRLDAGDAELVERARHAVDRRPPVLAPDDELGHQGIVVERDLAALVDAGVDANPRACGRSPRRDPARRRDEAGGGVLGRDPALDRPASRGHIGLSVPERLAGRHPQLLPHKVDARHQLRDRVLDLEPGVDLEEVEASRLVEQELHRPGVLVAGRGEEPAGGAAHLGPERRVDRGGRRLLDELLVPPLDRALALAQVHDVTVGVREHLDLDVAGLDDRLLEVDRAVAERRPCFGARQAERGLELPRRRHQAHTLPAPAPGRLDHHREADVLRGPERFGVRFDRIGGARHDRHARLDRGAARRGLVAHAGDRGRRGAHVDETRAPTRLGEPRVLGQEPVAGMHGLGARLAGDGDQAIDDEVALGGRGRADRPRLVGEPHVERVPIGLGEDGHRADARVPARPHHAHRDLTAVGDEELSEHVAPRRLRPGRGGARHHSPRRMARAHDARRAPSARERA